MAEYRARQLAELDALRAMFPEDGAVQLDTLPDGAATAGEAVQADLTNSPSATLSFTVMIPASSLRGRPVGLHFQLPKAYPEQEPAVQVICEAGRGSALKALLLTDDVNFCSINVESMTTSLSICTSLQSSLHRP